MPFPYAPWGDEDELNRVMWFFDDEVGTVCFNRVFYLVYINLEAEFPELEYHV